LAVAFVIAVLPVTVMPGAMASACFQAAKLLVSWVLTALPFRLVGMVAALRLAATLAWTCQPVRTKPPFPGLLGWFEQLAVPVALSWLTFRTWTSIKVARLECARAMPGSVISRQTVATTAGSFLGKIHPM
jgi:hypothetical protein